MLNKYCQYHQYHLVERSFWPFLSSNGALTMVFGLTMWMHSYTTGATILKFGLLFTIFISILWWWDVVEEGTIFGDHTKIVKAGLKNGMILFIVSEVMFFFSFFWAFFHSSLNPSIILGSIWPPEGISVIDPVKIPLLNTIILVVSGIALTWSHSIIKDKVWQQFDYYNFVSFYIITTLKLVKKGLFSKKVVNNIETEESETFFNKFWESAFSLYLTVFLGLIFTYWQGFEYYSAIFYIFDGVYGSTFYMTTGLHGMHVLVGTIFLIVCAYRLIHRQFTWKSHIGYECAIWYWHFVDVVWIIVFIWIYCWGAGYNNFFK